MFNHDQAMKAKCDLLNRQIEKVIQHALLAKKVTVKKDFINTMRAAQKQSTDLINKVNELESKPTVKPGV